MKRDAEVMSHGPGNKKCPRHFDHLGYVFGYGDRNCWNPSLLNCALNQPDGLVANRSSRGQQSNIRRLFADGSCNIGSHGLFEPLGIHAIADETEEISG